MNPDINTSTGTNTNTNTAQMPVPTSTGAFCLLASLAPDPLHLDHSCPAAPWPPTACCSVSLLPQALLHPEDLCIWPFLKAELSWSFKELGRSMFIVCFWKKNQKAKVEEKEEEEKKEEKRKERRQRRRRRTQEGMGSEELRSIPLDLSLPE